MAIMTGLFENLAFGFSIAFSPTNLLYCFIGVTLGTFVGVLPGIGALAAISMLLPITYHLDPIAAVIMIAGIYYGCEYGGSIASILLNLPGSPSSAVTCLDGYPMSQQGRGGVALLMTTVASLAGACIGIALLTTVGPAIAAIALAFGAAEYFSMMVLGLVASGSISHGSALKGISMVVLGVLLGIVGADIATGVPRFVLGFRELYDGISLVALAMGLFGISEVILSASRGERKDQGSKVTFRSMVPTRDDVRRSYGPILRGSAVGSFLGGLPGTGRTISSFIAYALEKRFARDPQRFGKGAIEGVMAPEAANNSASQTSFIPTLTLGIPGDASMALLLAAIMLHGIAPGPQLVVNHPEMFWGLIASFFIGNVLLVILNVPLIGVWLKILSIPYFVLFPSIVLLVAIGVYTINYSVFDVTVVAVFGVVGYVLRSLDFEPAPLLIGFVLGPMLEENMRRALVLSHGDFSIFLARPISASMLGLTLLLLTWTVVAELKRR